MSKTKFDAKAATLAEIVTEYNRIAESLGEKTVKSFKDKQTAEKRLTAIQGLELAIKAARKAKAKAKPDNVVDKPKGKAKSKPTETDLLGEDDDEDEAPKKKGKVKSKPTEKDLLGEDDDEAPKKKAKAKAKPADAPEKAPRGKNSLEKGKEPTFEHEPFSIQKEPREGTFRSKILGMLESEEGTTVKAIEKAFAKYWEKKGIEPKVDIHLRALEMIRLLRYQNGFGFTERDGRIFALRAKKAK